MSVLPIRHYPDQALRERCRAVPYLPELKELAQSMLETMYASKGVGLAAPQIGLNFRMFVADVEWVDKGRADSKAMVFINPVIVSVSKEMVNSVEGCLSFPGESVTVPRFRSVVVKALDIDGKPVQVVAHGLLSACIQHECDHLDGFTLERHMNYYDRTKLQKKVKQSHRAAKRLLRSVKR